MKNYSLNPDSILPMKLQYFADSNPDETEPADPDPDTNKPNSDDNPDEENPDGGKTYTDEDVNKIVNQKFAKWKKDEADKVEEAKKLAEMDKDQKTQYEIQQAKEAREAAEAKVAKYEMTGQARNMAREAGISVTDDDLTHIVTGDADETKANLDWLGSLAKRIKADAETDFLKGKSPKVGGNSLNRDKGELGKKLAENATKVKENPYFQTNK